MTDVTVKDAYKTRLALVELVRSVIGIPYRSGGRTIEKGFDCSGLIQWAYAQLGLSIGGTTFAQWDETEHISLSQAQAGDLVFFRNTTEQRGPSTRGGSDITHVGLYIGNGRMINAPSEGQTIRVDDITSGYWAKHFAGVGRYVQAADENPTTNPHEGDTTTPVDDVIDSIVPGARLARQVNDLINNKDRILERFVIGVVGLLTIVIGMAALLARPTVEVIGAVK